MGGEIMEEMVLQFGPYVLPFPVALSSFLAIVYKFFDKPDGQTSYLSDKLKNGIALLFGIAFAWYLLLEEPGSIILKTGIGWSVYGLLEGASAVGLYKSVRTWTDTKKK
jgi:hypothetical protein